jgi:P2-related tail formation protein
MPELNLQPSVNDARGQSLLQLLSRLDNIDLSSVLVYRLDSAPDSALLPLAWQFDMLAPQWQLGASTGEAIDALTDIDSLTDIDTLSSTGSVSAPSDFDSLRTLLKAAIPLHRTRGTPYAIKTALSSLGWSGSTLQEGQASWGGVQYPASQGWAVFRVLLTIGPGQTVGTSDASRIVAAVNFFKPVRTLLDSLWFIAQPLGDLLGAATDAVVSIFKQMDRAPTAGDQTSAPGWPVTDLKGLAPTYSAHFVHSGITYGASQPAVADAGVVAQGTPVSAAI